MNLTNVQRLLDATEGPQPVRLEIEDPDVEFEVQLMAEAGLVDATLGNGKEGSCTVVHRLTDLGLQFLRALNKRHAPPVLLQSKARYAARRESAHREIIEKWNANFALDFRQPPRAS